jgi:hypothetical protein
MAFGICERVKSKDNGLHELLGTTCICGDLDQLRLRLRLFGSRKSQQRFRQPQHGTRTGLSSGFFDHIVFVHPGGLEVGLHPPNRYSNQNLTAITAHSHKTITQRSQNADTKSGYKKSALRRFFIGRYREAPRLTSSKPRCKALTTPRQRSASTTPHLRTRNGAWNQNGLSSDAR